VIDSPSKTWRNQGIGLRKYSKEILMKSRRLRLFTAGAMMLLAQLAHAQYSWIDEKGTRVFSDRPPPPNTPASRILKAPRTLQLPAPAAAAAPSASAVAADSKPAAAPTLAERDADFKKRAAERAENERKAQDEAERKVQEAENCKAARQMAAQVRSGMRMAHINDKGEREVLGDAERAQQLQRAERVLASCR
jgi:flagellar biosynthesis GTPase FlhF